MNEILKKYVGAMDPELKDFILKEEWRKKIKKICSDYGIKDNALAVGIENETLMVMIGVEYVGNFLTNIQNIGVPKIQAEPLAEAIGKDVLFSVAEYLSPKEAEKELPDGSAGSISNTEVVIKNPIQIKPTQNISQNIPKPIQNPTPTKSQAQPSPISVPIKTPTASNTEMSWEERKKKAEEALKVILDQLYGIANKTYPITEKEMDKECTSPQKLFEICSSRFNSLKNELSLLN